ncbi:MAG: hypothetical protein ACXW0Z_15710, partial [Gemmatirosa sp.]
MCPIVAGPGGPGNADPSRAYGARGGWAALSGRAAGGAAREVSAATGRVRTSCDGRRGAGRAGAVGVAGSGG